MDIKIIVATHKPYKMPKDDMYLPLQVGAEGKSGLGFAKDNSGREHISYLNPYFSELTGLYWAWKNLKVDYLGLVHYRRYFTCKKIIPKKENKKFEIILNKSQLEKYLKYNDIIVPKARNYFIENIYNHYKHTLYVEPLDETRNIILEKYPEYVKEFDNLKKTTKMHAFNMFIMKKELLDSYCKWLFDILFELQKRVDVKKYDSFHARFFGRVSELLLDVWLKTNNLKYKELKVIDMQNINWINKGTAFLKAKFLNQKYEKSF